jgi:electron transport complex protein RnfD
MTTWTTPESFFGSVEALDAASGATPLAVVKESLAKGMTLPEIFAANNFSYTQMLFVRIGSAGEISAIALLLGFIYLLVRRVIRPTITLSVWAGAIVLSGILWLCNPDQFTDPIFTMLTGGMLLGSIFMATDYVTSPMSTKGMIIFGVGIGVLTVLIRQFGAYPEGISFAILIMNATVPLINMYCKPKRFGK